MEIPIIFTNLPLLQDLCHILVSIDPTEKKDKSVKSDFQWQLLKTRLLLFSDKNIIATPVSGLLQYIHVIAKKEYVREGSLSAMLQKHRLKVESVGILSYAVYEQCLIYNLIAKLAPFWNKVEKYFIEGRYFLMQRGVLHAVELNVIIKGDMLMLYASPLKIWLREVSLFDLLPPSNIQETLSRPFFIDLFTERQWVHVLPSFKRGHLVYVTNQIPKESGFEDYLQMRRHWKNTYGYRLPEEDSSIIYVGISFFNNNDFLYPLECVRRGMHMNKDEFSIVVNFAKAVAVKAGVVCGNHLKLSNLAELQNAPKARIIKQFKWNESALAELDSELLNKWLCHNDDSTNLTAGSQDISLYTQSQSEMTFPPAKDIPNKKREHDSWLMDCSQFIDGLTKGSQKRSYLKACRTSFQEFGTPILNDKPDPPLIVEEPLPSGSYLNRSCVTMEAELYQIQTNPRYKPCFNKIVKPDVYAEQIRDPCAGEVTMKKYDTAMLTDEIESGTETFLLSNVISLEDAGPYKPVFKNKRQLYYPTGINKIVEKEKIKCHISITKESSKEKKNSNVKHIKKVKKKIKQMGADIQEMTSEINYDLNIKEVLADSIETNLQNLTSKLDEGKDEKSLENNSEVKNKQAEKIETNHSKNSQVSLSNQESTAIRQKKSVVLNANEIENLVSLNLLKKANVPSLCNYLKGKGVPFSKDKKEVLMQKVKEIVTINNQMVMLKSNCS